MDEKNPSSNPDAVKRLAPVPFGRVPGQRLGALMFYIAGLFVLIGAVIQAAMGQSNGSTFGEMLLVVFFVVPIVVVTIGVGVISYAIGSCVWLFNIRSIVTKSDRLTILRSIPPVLLSIGTVVYLVLLVGNTFPWDAQGYQGSFWWSVETYFTFYLVMTVIGLGLEILVSVRRKRPVTQAPTDRPDTLNG